LILLFDKITSINKEILRIPVFFNFFPEDPAFSIGVDQFSNVNNLVLDQLIVETIAVLKTSFSPSLYPALS
jgi:hypothetical protein